MPYTRMLRRVDLLRTDVSEESIASIIKVTRITFPRNVLRLLVTADDGHRSLILVTLMIETIRSPKRWFLQEPHAVISL
jgi:hypothetical protein